MKKLIAICCGMLCLHNVSQGPVNVVRSTRGSTDERSLIKALASIVNPHAKKKNPQKKGEIPPAEYPWL